MSGLLYRCRYCKREVIHRTGVSLPNDGQCYEFSKTRGLIHHRWHLWKLAKKSTAKTATNA